MERLASLCAQSPHVADIGRRFGVSEEIEYVVLEVLLEELFRGRCGGFLHFVMVWLGTRSLVFFAELINFHGQLINGQLIYLASKLFVNLIYKFGEAPSN